jgi:arylsulfatase A-like enzyme
VDSRLSRRDFLKILSILATTPISKLGYFTGIDWDVNRENNGIDLPNIIIILFDTLSAKHLPIYGYSRNTAPNLTRFAEKAIVYHSHYAAGNYTTPSTASLLTGTYPWTHKAFSFMTGIEKNLVPNNIFQLMGDNYHKVGYGQNLLADVFLSQLDDQIDNHVDVGEFSLIDHTVYTQLAPNDKFFGLRSLESVLFSMNQPGSIFYGTLNNFDSIIRQKYYNQAFSNSYPRGLPDLAEPTVTFQMESVFDGIMDVIDKSPLTTFAYFHLWPPHEPYRPKKRFIRMFNDTSQPIEKAEHFFSKGVSSDRLSRLRTRYDEYIAHTDAEFGRLLDHLDKKGLMETSYVIVTSDHGQLFERGVHGHATELLYEPIIRIPLLISKPGQSDKQEIFSTTSNIDLLPTILRFANQPIPPNCEGIILPGLGGDDTQDRSVYSIQAHGNHVYRPIQKATVALIKERYKLIYYFGYDGFDGVSELYDLNNDPEELENLIDVENSIGGKLLDEVKGKLQDVARNI